MVSVRFRFAWWAVLSTALVAGTSRTATSQTDFAHVKSEVAAAQARHIERVGFAQFDSTMEHFDELNKHALVSKIQTRTRRSGSCYLFEDIVDVVPPPDLKSLRPRRNSQVLARNSRYGFELTRPGGPTEWRLKGVNLADSPDPSPGHPNTESLAEDTLFKRPYVVMSPSTLTDLFNTPSFRLISCAPSPRNPALVRVQFEDAPPPVGKKTPPRSSGWCDLDPQAGWSIRGADVTSYYPKSTDTYLRDVASTIDPDGFIRIDEEREEVKVMKGDLLEAHRIQLTKYKIWVDRDVPEREFSLTAYNMPEPPGITFVRPTPTYVWLLLGAAGFLVTAGVFRWLALRKSPQSATL